MKVCGAELIPECDPLFLLLVFVLPAKLKWISIACYEHCSLCARHEKLMKYTREYVTRGASNPCYS